MLFGEARTYSAYQPREVPDSLLHQAWDLARMGPTSVNCQPARITFVRSPEAKARLKPALAPGNVDKTMAAPVTAIIAHDMEFYEKLPQLFPHADAKAWFVGNQPMIDGTAFRNGTLQSGYFILALRALGLDCGAMSGFDNAKLDAEDSADTFGEEVDTTAAVGVRDMNKYLVKENVVDVVYTESLCHDTNELDSGVRVEEGHGFSDTGEKVGDHELRLTRFKVGKDQAQNILI